MSKDKNKRTHRWVPKAPPPAAPTGGERHKPYSAPTVAALVDHFEKVAKKGRHKPYSTFEKQQYNQWVPKTAKNTQHGTHIQSTCDNYDRETKRDDGLSNFGKARPEVRNRQLKKNNLLQASEAAYIPVVDPTVTVTKVEMVEETNRADYERIMIPNYSYEEIEINERKDEIEEEQPIVPPRGFLFKPDEEWVSYDYNKNSGVLGCRFQYATEHKVKLIKLIPFPHGDSRPHHLLRATLLDTDPLLVKVLHTTRQVVRLRPANYLTNKIARLLPFNAKTWRTVPGNRPQTTKVTISYNILTQLIQMNVSNRSFDSKTVHERMVQTARSIATINFDQYSKSLIDDTRSIAFIYSEYKRQTSTLDFYHPDTVIGGFFTDTNTESIRSHVYQQSNQNVKLMLWAITIFQLLAVLLSAYLLVPTLLDRLCPTLIRMTIEQLWPAAVSALRQQLLFVIKKILTDYVLLSVTGCVAALTAACCHHWKTFQWKIGYEMRPIPKNERISFEKQRMNSGSSRRAT